MSPGNSLGPDGRLPAWWDGGMSTPMPFITVGHSAHPLEHFLDLLTGAGVGILVDVRKLPGSRAQPQFNGDTLSEALAGVGIGYRHASGLGGRRKVSTTVPFEVNAGWRNRSFHNYADHALTGEFNDALAGLVADGRRATTAIMCAEAVWWRCHRRLIADNLLSRGHGVQHLMASGRLQEATLTPGAVVAADGAITYPALSSG